MLNKLYITTPIYYVNASPHIGHSYTCIAADCLARSLRQQLGKENVWFLTGTDEHGQKIQKAAGENNLSPQEFVDKVVVQFTGLWEKLNISYDDFIRTTEKRHIKVVEQVLEILYKKGDIYPDKYQGWYCTPCETFWVESQLKNQFCPDCLRPVERIAEENFFFRLSAYQEWLIDYLNQHQDFIKPQNRLVEVFKFLKLNKLDDLCISRPKERLGWGIPLPFSPAHVTYVWFDALVNYISAVGEFNSSNTYNSKWWDDQTQVVHLVGKDILRQHAVYWPIMLKALGMRMPDTIFAHGWWMMGEDKMSKSRGNVVSPLRMLDKYGVDAYRYFLLRDVPFGLDGNFSEEAIIKRFNGDLANDLGNLVFRTLTMLEKYYQGNVPQLDISKIKFDERGEKIKRTLGLVNEEAVLHRMELALKSDFNFSAALEKIWLGVNLVNKYIEEKKPWNLSKDNKHTELQGFIRLLVEAIRKISEDIYPFLPQTAQAIKEQLGQDKIKKGNPLFPRILLT